MIELACLLLERPQGVRHAGIRREHEENLVRRNVRKAERPRGQDAVGLERFQASDEVEHEVVVGLPSPDFLDPSLRAWTEGENRQRTGLAQLRSEIVHDGGDRGKPRIPIVEAGPLLLPLSADGNELARVPLLHGITFAPCPAQG